MIIKDVVKIKNEDTLEDLGKKVNKELENIRNTLNALGTTTDADGNIIITSDRAKVKRNDAYYIENQIKKRVSQGLKDAIDSALPKVDKTPPDHTQCDMIENLI